MRAAHKKSPLWSREDIHKGRHQAVTRHEDTDILAQRGGVVNE